MKRLVLLVAVVALLVSACGGGGSDKPSVAAGDGAGGGHDTATTHGAGPAPTEVKVVAKDLAFKPSKAKVAVGGTVTWSFEDGSVPHNVVADDKSFKSENLTTGTFSHTFDKAGTFKYTCTIHPAMKGTVTAVA
jgi:plastocyanin